MAADDILLYGIFAYWGLFFLMRPILAIARCGILRKTGNSWWKGLIPFYGEYLQYQVSWKTDWYWFHLLSTGGRFFCYLFFATGVLYQIGFYTRLELWGMILLTLPDVVIALIGLCVRYLAMEHLADSFGKSQNYAMWLYLLNPLFMLILAFDQSVYVGVKMNSGGSSCYGRI